MNPQQSPQNQQPPVAPPVSPQNTYPTPQQPPHTSSTLAIISLVLGILGFLTGLFIIGGVFGLIAIIIGALALKSKQSKALSIIGIALGSIALLTAIGALLLVGGTFKSLKESAETTTVINESDLVLSGSEDAAVQFLYPKNWTVEKPTDGSGVTRYSDFYRQETKAVNSSMVYAYQLGEVKQLSESDRKAEATAILAKSTATDPLVGDYLGCEDIKNIGSKEFNQNGLIGARVEFTCKLKTDKTPTHGVIIVAKDSMNIMHHFVLFSTSEARWSNNLPTFNKMLDSIAWKNGSLNP